MDGKQLRRLKPELDLFLERYLPLFGRSENHAHAEEFVHGLLGGTERRNIENIAEAVRGGVVRTMQKFVSQGCWHDADVLAELRGHLAEVLGEDEATINVDETGFPKKGTKSVGVKRQYSGALGRVDNCQIGVMANYCSTIGHTLFDRRLFLPEEWAADRARRAEAGVPEGVVFRTKPELALEMVQAAIVAGVPFRWVGGDCVYGDSPKFVQGLRALEKWYVLDTSSEARVWVRQPRMRKAGSVRSRGGRPLTKPRPITKPMPVSEAVAALPNSAFRRITVADGSQGPLVYDSVEPVGERAERRTDRLVFRRGPALDRTGTPAGTPVFGTRAGTEISSVERAGGHPAPATCRATIVAVDDRAGHSGGQRRKRPGRIRNAGLDRLASPYGALAAGSWFSRLAESTAGGKKNRR